MTHRTASVRQGSARPVPPAPREAGSDGPDERSHDAEGGSLEPKRALAGTDGRTGDRCVFLDGLRGWGALAVVLWHCFIEVFPVDSRSARILALLPPFNGVIAVDLFFVISGFSLSIAYVRRRDPAGLARMAASRYPRLALPILAACALVYAAMVSGLIPPPELRPAPLNGGLTFVPSIAHLLRFSLFDVFFRFSPGQAYIIPLWTMPIELAGSALVFALLAVFGRHQYRDWIHGVLFVGLALWESPYCLFVAGMMLAEFYTRDWFRGRAARVVFVGLFVLGGLGPLLTQNYPPIFLASMVGMCAAAGWVPFLRGFFETGLSQFLGRISFPLYLLHAPLLYSFSLWAIAMLTPSFGNGGITYLLVDLVTVPVAVAAAAAFAPVNDAAVALSRRFGAWTVEHGQAALRRRFVRAG